METNRAKTLFSITLVHYIPINRLISKLQFHIPESNSTLICHISWVSLLRVAQRELDKQGTVPYRNRKSMFN